MTLSVRELYCGVRAGDAPFTEVHAGFSMSYVEHGSFGYRVRGRRYEMVPGSILIGAAGDEYVCTHEHAFGDVCLSVELDAALADSLGPLSGVWRRGAVPPLGELVVLGELLRAAAHGDSDVAPGEAALLLAARVAALGGAVAGPRRTPQPRDRRRAVQAAHFIDAHFGDALDLERVATEVGLGAYHFLRVFSAVVGVTPHQYLVRTRLRHAAALLATDTRPVTDVALDVGFTDLSNFVRSFRRAAGASPRAFRQAARGDRGPQRGVPRRAGIP